MAKVTVCGVLEVMLIIIALDYGDILTNASSEALRFSQHIFKELVHSRWLQYISSAVDVAVPGLDMDCCVGSLGYGGVVVV